MRDTTTASRGWALVIALVVVLLGFAGWTAWTHHTNVASPLAPVGFAAAPEMKAEPQTAARPVPAAPAAANSPASNPVAARPATEPPRFDIVRVEPSGDTVVAGKGEPHAKVALLSQGVVVAETEADANGHFVVLPPALPPGDHALSLRQTPIAGAPSTSEQSVTVAVPLRGKGSVVVALAEPGRATKVLSAPEAPVPPKATEPVATAPPAVSPPVSAQAVPSTPAAPPVAQAVAAPTPEMKVALRAVDLEHGDGFHASGVAAPGTPLQLYLNNSHIADVVAAQDGTWTVTIRKGLASGHYVVRADAGGKGRPVSSRAEVPFDVPVEKPVDTAAAAAASAQAQQAASEIPSATPPDARRQIAADASTAEGMASTGNAVIDEIQTARVVAGDSLWAISLSRLGQATRYTQIYAANEKQIRDPNLIYPGQVFVLPR